MARRSIAGLKKKPIGMDPFKAKKESADVQQPERDETPVSIVFIGPKWLRKAARARANDLDLTLKEYLRRLIENDL